MKRVLADHNAPRPLLRVLTAFNITTAEKRGWAQLRNGKLLDAAEDADFGAVLTADKSIPDENVIAGRKIGLVALSDNHCKIVRNHLPTIAEALHKVKPSQVLRVHCGTFAPKWNRRIHT